MKKQIGIYIPSRGRCLKHKTWKSFDKNWQKNIHIVAPENEREEYLKSFPQGVKINVMGCPVNGISNTRQWIMENGKHDYIVMFDDDMQFNCRVDNSLKVADKNQVNDMMQLLGSWLDEGFVHIGVSARQGNNYVETDYDEISRMNNSYGFNVEIFHKEGIRFDRIPLMEDFDVTLSLLEKGYPNRVVYKYAWGQGKSGDAGGCSLYRNDELQKQAAFKLKELHPYCVKVVKKTSKESWGGFESAVRYDVVIQWNKAYIPKKKGSFAKFFR